MADRPAEPSWWYEPRPTLAAVALGPVAAVVGRVAAHRIARAPAHRSPLPVICVGNFTVGGAGKTPMALHVGTLLAARGVSFAYLSRGYGGRLAGPHLVDPVADRATDVGDEPLLLARAAPTLVARDRAAGARAIEALGSRPAAIVMDDGLQNPALAKDLAIAVVDGGRGLGNGRVMPAGPLRAPLTAQLAACSAIVVLGRDGADVSRSPIAAALRQEFDGPVLAASTVAAGDRGWLGQAPVVAFAGIADPSKLFATLRGLGADVIEAVGFPDHHPFSEADARRLLALADVRSAMLVTTEKDLVRLSGAEGARAELAARARPLPIRVAMSAGDETRLAALVDGALAEAAARLSPAARSPAGAPGS